MPWAYEGIECYVPAVPRRYRNKPLYRVPLGGHYVYTDDPDEYPGPAASSAPAPIECYVVSQKAAGHVPLWRMWNARSQDHCYHATIRPRPGYEQERLLGYVSRRRCDGYVAFFRTWDPSLGKHFYTTKVDDVDDHAPRLPRSRLLKLLVNRLGKLGRPDTAWGPPCDDDYFCPTVDAAQRIIDKFKLVPRDYVPDLLDCDDFAHLLKAAFIEDAFDIGFPSKPYAFGTVLGCDPTHEDRLHFLNVAVTSNGHWDPGTFKVHFVEPQTGKIRPPSPKILHSLRSVSI